MRFLPPPSQVRAGPDRGRQETPSAKALCNNPRDRRFTSLLWSRSQEDGALKLTIQKFYRVAGGSTQLHGVASDIVLPSLSDLPEYGEGALKNCLAYDEVPRARFTKWSDGNHQLFIDELKRRSETRVEANPEFRYVMEYRNGSGSGWMKRISLNEDVRRTEMSEDKVRKETRSKERLARRWTT